ncbi:MAG TPA: hypothetical protein DE191_15230 [Enterobacter sp.]|nr:hypothetical protein [Enterobacter sp.]
MLGAIGAAPETLQRPGASAFDIITGGLFAGVFIGKLVRQVRVCLSAQVQQACRRYVGTH